MKVDTYLPEDLRQVEDAAQEQETAGFDGLITIETAHDPFFPLLLAARATAAPELMTAIAVSFARSPMVMANIGHDLNSYSKGRFILGLGSQIQAHITKRFSMPWSSPAKRMKEFILAMRAIWACWHEQEPLNFRGDFYTHTLMSPLFMPEDNEYGPPKVFLAAVGPRMAEVAGEVADGAILHAFTTRKYIEEVSLPAIERGRSKAGKTLDDFEIVYPGFTITGTTEEEYRQQKLATRNRLAFYGSTPAYKNVLELHGWDDLQPELKMLSKKGRWDAMGNLITDDILEEFAVSGTPEEAIESFVERYGKIVTRTSAQFAHRDAQDARENLSRLQRA